MKNICIIPARGGSTRIPHKNIKPLNDQPLIAYAIKTAIESNLFDKILVSTDCPEIAKVAKEYGAEVPFLRQNNSDNFTHVNFAVHEALQQAMDHWQTSFDYMVSLFANSPFISKESLIKAFNNLQDSDKSNLISSCEFPLNTPWQALKITTKNNDFEFLHPDMIKTRTQDRPELFAITGTFVMSRCDDFLSTQEFMHNAGMYPLSWIEGFDIDNIADFELSEILIKNPDFIKNYQIKNYD